MKALNALALALCWLLLVLIGEVRGLRADVLANPVTVTISHNYFPPKP